MEEAVVMPQPSQEFCLRWNNYHSSLVSTLDSFKNDQVFVDVTIGCEGKYLGAHKMLLSACSVFFRDLIKVYPCPHPIIILPPDVRMSDMEKLLHFIYQGEVNVLQENLARFLKTAEMLKIKGLAEDSDKQKVLRTCTDGQESPSVSAGGGGAAAPAGNSSSEGSAASPKRPRLSLDTSSAAASSGSPASATAALTVTCSSSNSNNCSSNSNAAATAALLLDTPNTPNNTEDSTHSANESDSDMLPVKQEMVELKNCSEFETDGEPFNPDKYLAAAANAESGSSKHQPPPPPGPLLPSYVPPPPIKAQEDSPASGNASDELSQGGGVSLRLLSGGMMMGVPPPPHLLRPPLNLSQTDTPLSSRYGAKRKSPSVETLPRRSPPQYVARHAPHSSSSYGPATPTSASLGPSYPRRSYPNSACKSSPRYRKSPVLHATYKGTPSNGRLARGSPKSEGPSPNSPPPPGKLRHCYSSPELMTTSSPDENVPQNFMGPGAHATTSPLTCEICHKTFTSRSNLNKHVRVQHSGEEYACQFCQRTFKNRYYIKEHTSLCVTANQKKVAAAAAAAAAVQGAISSSPCPPPPSAVNSYSSLSAMTPPAHPAAMMPAPALHAAAAPLDLHKFEPPDYDEQPTDLAIHGRSASPREAN